MRTSISDVGLVLKRERHRLGTVARFADHLDVVAALEDHAEPGPHEVLIVGQEHPDRHGGGSNGRTA
jgi:hypothetical protein